MVAPKRILALGAGALLLLCLIPFVARAVRTDVSRDFPIYHNNGLPDLTIDAKRFVSQMEIVDRLFDSSSCEIIEGSVGGTGYRRLLRFETTIINGGDGDLVGWQPHRTEQSVSFGLHFLSLPYALSHYRICRL
jgi:hypothetical protein